MVKASFYAHWRRLLYKRERFWRRVEPAEDGFWIWKGSRTTNEYGFVMVMGVRIRAHRVAWIMTYGSIPDGLYVCHACDTPLCCNPLHLWLGTSEDNIRDAASKGRMKGRPKNPPSE